MPRVCGPANLYLPHTKGYFIYQEKQRFGKYLGVRIWPCKKQKAATFYSVDEARSWIDTIPTECPVHHAGCFPVNISPGKVYNACQEASV